MRMQKPVNNYDGAFLRKVLNDYVLESLFNNVGPRHFVNKKAATQSLIIFTKMCHHSF